MKITVLGLGYVGLVTAVCFSELGHEVTGFDVDEKKVNTLESGEIPIYEPALKELAVKNVKEGRLNFLDRIQNTIDSSKIIFIAVGTPEDSSGKPDLKYVYSAIDMVLPFIKTYKIFVLKSTVPLGTNNSIYKYIKEKTNVEFDVVSNPEFLKEGSAVNDFMKPDRIVIGTNNLKSAEVMKELYSHFVRNGHPILVMDPLSSEIVKYSSNTLLALKVAYINEIARLCDCVGADIRKVREGIISDPRIGSKFLYPSIGFGGSCFPKDVSALVSKNLDLDLNLLFPTAILESNKNQIAYFIEKIISFFGKENLKNKTLAIWGTAFKAGTDDIRESPAIKIIEGLLSSGARLKIFDPIALENTKKYFANSKDIQKITFCENEKSSILESSALVVCTEWLQFRNPNFNFLSENLTSKVIFDGRNLYDPETVKHYGLTLIGVGVESKVRTEIPV